MKRILSIVLPCHNEEESINLVLGEVKRAKQQILKSQKFTEVRIIVVDDGSSDKSAELLSSIEDITLIQNPEKLGYGEALKTGFNHCSSDYVCFLDLDCSYPPEYIEILANRAIENQCDMVVGRRSISASGMSATRGLGNFLYTWISQSLLGVSIGDVCSGFRVLNGNLAKQCLYFENTNLSFALEMSLRFTANKFKVEEIEVPYRLRAGYSKLSVISDGITFLSLIIKVFFQNILINNTATKADRR